MSEAALREGCERLGLSPSADSIRKLLILKDYLKFYGASMNLTGRLDDAALDDHLLEGLTVVALATRCGIQGRWLDVGSGGGLPGLVLASWLELDFVFVEPRAKRASVLELGLAKLGRRDIPVLRGRLEQGRWRPVERDQLEGPFDAASARAVFELERWRSEASAWVRPGGLICLHLRSEEPDPLGEILGRVDLGRWSAVGVACVPRGTG